MIHLFSMIFISMHNSELIMAHSKSLMDYNAPIIHY